jgi:tRNA nucleotidyltransferase (CCA-adding enzyme)
LDVPITEALARSAPHAADVRRWIATIGRPQLHAFFRLSSARWSARRDGKSPPARAVHSLYRSSLRAALTEPVDLRDLAVDGDDLRAVGIAPGPQLGKILSKLLERVIENPSLNTYEQLLELARREYSEAQ